VTWVSAVLHNGLGRHQEALDAARQAAGHKLVHLSMWALPELVVAGARTGNTALARDALDQLSEWTQAGRTDWGLRVEARSRALLSEGEAADRLYLEAIDRLGRTGMRPDLARAHLLYGEWLRRQRRRGEARVQLRTSSTSPRAAICAASCPPTRTPPVARCASQGGGFERGRAG